MPATNRLIDFKSTYVEQDTAAALRSSALELVRQILPMQGVHTRHHRELLSIALWKWTEAPGAAPHPKYNLRYVSRGVLAMDDAKVNHDHVWPRKWIIDELLSKNSWAPDALEDFLGTYGIACVVTTDEHARLSGKTRTGWQRYVDAGVDVWDRQLGRWADLGTTSSEPLPAEVDDVSAPAGVDLERIIRERAGDAADLLIELARSAEREVAVAVPGGTRDPARPIGAYFRIHDAQIEEPTPAVAYAHWNGKVSFRLTEDDLANGDLRGVATASHPKYGVVCQVCDSETLRSAQHLLYLALTKVRSDF